MDDFEVVQLHVKFTREDGKEFDWGTRHWNKQEYRTLEEYQEHFTKNLFNKGTFEFKFQKLLKGQEARAIWFRVMCEKHDLTYAFSGDHSKWQAGEHSYAQIKEFAKYVENAAEIWNEVVKEKLQPDSADMFFWD